MAEDPSTAYLREIRNWTRVGFFNEVRSMLTSVLNDDKKRKLYQSADGSASLDTLRRNAQMGYDRALEFCQRCESVGLMEQINGKWTRLFDLRNFGLFEEETDGQ